MNNIGVLTGYNYLSGFEVNLDLEARKQFQKTKVNPLLDPDYCEAWTKYIAKKGNNKHVYGGYMENRSFLWRGSYLKPNNSIHLGVDFSFAAGTPIHCPVAFEVKDIFRDPDQSGGWGERVLIETEKGLVIFAHLSGVSLKGEKNNFYSAGTFIGTVATKHSNGGWFPHLHLQGVKNVGLIHLDGYSHRYKGMEKDYPYPLPMIGIT
jgi:murein DD-endopeptidase MepM/ murein hydrolase activator NlpD